MYKPSDVEDYISHHSEWSDELNKLRSVLLESELDETIKWYIPTYTFNNRNVIGIGAFKEWVAIWFFHGAFLSDPYAVLLNAQEGKTKGLRQWRFKKGESIDLLKIMEYVVEAVENQKKGLETSVKKAAKKLLEIPINLSESISKNKEASHHWKLFSIAKKNEFIQHIHEAKREETKNRRIVKIIALIESGQGLNDRYK